MNWMVLFVLVLMIEALVVWVGFWVWLSTKKQWTHRAAMWSTVRWARKQGYSQEEIQALMAGLATNLDDEDLS